MKCPAVKPWEWDARHEALDRRIWQYAVLCYDAAMSDAQAEVNRQK